MRSLGRLAIVVSTTPKCTGVISTPAAQCTGGISTPAAKWTGGISTPAATGFLTNLHKPLCISSPSSLAVVGSQPYDYDLNCSRRLRGVGGGGVVQTQKRFVSAFAQTSEGDRRGGGGGGDVQTQKRFTSAFAQTSGGDRHGSSGFEDNESTKARPLELEKVSILKKTSRYEYEKSLAPGVNDFELERILATRGSDFRTLLNRHDVHLKNLDRLQNALANRGVQCTVLENADLNEDVIDESDAIFSAGGDGIFLMAANKVVNRNKPVIGINTDPTRSEGHLCLPKRYTSTLDRGIDKLMSGKFHWLMRKRIRLAMKQRKDAPIPDPILLKDQTPSSHEHRFTEHEQEIKDSKLRQNLWERSAIHTDNSDESSEEEIVVLPSRALNDVFIGESISARVSYFEMSIDGKASSKHKCSGLVIATGTGSNSWYLNIHKLSADNVSSVVDILNQEAGANLPEFVSREPALMEKVAEKYNRSLTFDPTEHKLAYIVRDPITNRVFRSRYPEHGFADDLVVRSRMFDACLVIDGGISYAFNDGATVFLSMHEEDSLRTVKLFDD